MPHGDIRTLRRVVIVEDNPGDVDLVRETLAEAVPGVDVRSFSRLADAAEYLATEPSDAVILDLSLPDASEMEGLRRIRAAVPAMPVIVLTGATDERLVAGALDHGAQDYLVKGKFDAALLGRSLRYAVERQRRAMRDAMLAEARAGRAAAEAAGRRALLLAEASRLLSHSLEDEKTFQRIADLMVPEVADACTIDLIDEGGGAGRLVALRADERLEPTLRRIRARHPLTVDAHDLRGQALRAGTGVLFRDIDDAQRREWAADDVHLQLLRELHATSGMVVPVPSREGIAGALVLLDGPSGRRLDDTDLVFAEELGRRVGGALENARLYRQAREAVAARDRFLSIASHELRTPLSALHVQVQSLRRQIARGDHCRERGGKLDAALALAERQTVRMARLLDELLDVSRLVSGRLRLSPEPVSLSDLAREGVERLSDEARTRGCRVAVHADGPVTGVWDRLALERVLVNLLVNALKYAPKSQVDVHVGLEGDRALLSVSDRGEGIAPEDAARVFEPFVRVATARHPGGMGLGLYVSRELVEAHGGSLSVSSRPGRGACFTVRLPVELPARAEREAGEAVQA